jgi:hypothetical protein
LVSFVNRKSTPHDGKKANHSAGREDASPTNETAKKTQRDFGTKALRREGVSQYRHQKAGGLYR